MNDEAKKTIGGGQPSELTDKALDESALDAVSGGRTSREWAEAAREWAKTLCTDDEEKEQQP